MDRTHNLFICFSVSETPGGRRREKKMSVHYFQLDNNSVLCYNLRPNLIPCVKLKKKEVERLNVTEDCYTFCLLFELKKIINYPLNTSGINKRLFKINARFIE